MKILLADDDHELVDVASYALQRKGFDVIVATDGAQALERWLTDGPDLVLLDVVMPEPDGLEVCRRIRDASPTPVILLTGIRDEAYILHGLSGGADDYVTKPFSLRELTSRIQAVMRRCVQRARAEPTTLPRVGRFTFDLESHVLVDGDSVVYLTPIEYRILSRLVLNEGRAVSFGDLVEHTWRRQEGKRVQLRPHIYNLHRKLQVPNGQPGRIEIVPGVGYRLL